MKLIFNKPYKSMRNLPVVELPDFVVLTGVNGARKSHLLEALETGAISIEGIPQNQVQGPKPIRRFDSTTLVPQDSASFSGAQISSERASFWNSISQFRNQQTDSFYAQLQHLNIPGLNSMDLRSIAQLEVPKLQDVGFTLEGAENAMQQIRQHIHNLESSVTNQFVSQDPNNRARLMERINSTKQLPLSVMNEDEFYDLQPDNWQRTDIFQQSFARLFSAYQHNWRENRLKRTGNEQGAGVAFLTESEFVAKFGEPPWDFLNEVLQAAELDFRIDEPSKWVDRPYDPILIDVKRGVQVKFGDLSSGERVLMSFALCLYHISDPYSSIEYPQILLFDEIDAPLHPSMTRSLLRTIEQTLVVERNIKVILTTHSPSTVAIAPDASIFVMMKDTNDRLKKSSKDSALGILTAGVPTLSVNYENRRQVFVESKYDVQYYGALYLKAKGYLISEVSIVFIASGVGGIGNCDQVKSVVNQLTEAGNKTVSGVVDWDLKNRACGTIRVIGIDERYAVDNFILDPLLVALLLVREKIDVSKLLNPGDEYSYVKFLNLDITELQRLSAKVVNALSERIDLKHQVDKTDVSFRYQNGSVIVVPKWFALLNGHDLEMYLKKAFPGLNRYQKEPDLKMAIINLVLDDRPDLTPESIVKLFLEIQKQELSSAGLHA